MLGKQLGYHAWKKASMFFLFGTFFIVFPYFLNLKTFLSVLRISPFFTCSDPSDFRLSWSGEDWSTVRARSWRMVLKSMQLPGRSRRTPVDAHIGQIGEEMQERCPFNKTKHSEDP